MSAGGTRIHPAAHVDPAARLGANVEIGPGSVVGPDVTIGDGTRIDANVLVTGWTTIGRDCHLHHGAVVGSPPQDLKYTREPSYLVIGDRTVLREYMTANLATEPGFTTRIGSDCLLMAYSHVAHNCQVGDRVVIANAVQMAGYVVVDDWAIVGGGTVVHQFTRIGRHAMIGGGSRIPQDVAPYTLVAGNPVRLAGLNLIGLKRRGFDAETLEALELAFRFVFRSKLLVGDALAMARDQVPQLPEVVRFLDFVEQSRRGITR